jgi:S1-C subfamily serine protease
VTTGSAADRAGIVGARSIGGGGFTIEDVIVAVEGTKIKSSNDIYKALDRHGVGDTVEVTVENKSRGGQRTVKVTLQPIQ